MRYARWTPGTVVAGPVYLDANILVGTVVRGHRLYRPSAQLLGELIAAQVSILVSDVAISESFWAVARLAYADLFKQPPSAKWGKEIYRRHVSAIFQQRGNWMTALPASLRGLINAGCSIGVVQPTQAQWLAALSMSLNYMDQLHLTPADAVHLSLAEAHAQTFVTADSDFGVIAQQTLTSNLTVLQMRP
jgi:predicted nucleic acid-binding protein